MPFSPRALRVAAACAALTAVTTFLLWALPRTYPPARTFDEQVALFANARYLARLWVNFGHVLLALVGYLGASVVLRRRSAALSATGFLFFVLWGFTELLGVAVNILAVNGTWRAGWAAADAPTREMLRTLITGWAAVWDAMFFVLLVGFLLGTLCLGAAAWRGRGLERVVGALLLLAAPLTVLIMASGYAGLSWGTGAIAVVYPALQPVSRLLMGAWLWRVAREAELADAPRAAPAAA
jgi:hypothetical protein